MQLFGFKTHSYKTAKAMERIVKDNVKNGVIRVFMKHAFVYNKHLFVGTSRKLIGLAINHLWGDVDSLKDNTMYDLAEYYPGQKLNVSTGILAPTGKKIWVVGNDSLHGHILNSQHTSITIYK